MPAAPLRRRHLSPVRPTRARPADSAMTMQHSPLDAEHRALGAKMVPFGGWEMPLSYPVGHARGAPVRVVRRRWRSTSAIWAPSGSRAREPSPRCNARFTNDLDKIGPGRAQYTHLLDPDDASVVDDIIIWWRRRPEIFDVMPNASNTDGVRERAGRVDAGSGDVTVTDTTASRAVIAVQGPRGPRPARCGVAPDGRRRSVGSGSLPFDFEGHACVVAGTGYTGEDGVECAVPVEVAARVLAAR